MSATFLIRIDAPDARFVAHDASLEAAGESVLQYGLGLDAEVAGENRLTELLSESEYDGAAFPAGGAHRRQGSQLLVSKE